MIRVFAGVVLSIALMGAASADPLAEARGGKLQCYSPDLIRKTCAALASYSFQGDGTISNHETIRLASKPFLVMTIVSAVTVKGEAICSPPRKEDVDAAEFTLDGAKVDEDRAAAMRARLLEAVSDRLGKQVCTTYLPKGDRLATQVSVDGVFVPAYTKEFIWVKPDEGYKVAP